MARKEFPTRVRVEVIKRARDERGIVTCEKCGLPAKRWQIDHVNPDGLTGQPVLSNAMLICEPCFSVKNPQDASNIAKAKRREAKHIGAGKPKSRLQSAGFQKAAGQHRATRPISKLAGLPRAHLYLEEDT